MRFQALPLFGLPRSADWKSVGKKTRASAEQTFPGLPADSWVGVMSWRFKTGSRTVASGFARSEPMRVGRSKGRASCTIAEGLKPVDKTPPALFILPADDAWHHASAAVQLTASDDFSGVKSVQYGIDGGPKQSIANGGTFQIAGQGAHTVDWEATDVAGNTGTRSAVVRVDAAPPTKPAFSRPFSVTSSTTPTFTWSASTDSGSGMKGYLLTIRKADSSVAGFRTVTPDTTSVPSPATLTDGQTYTAVVTAVDNTVDPAWATDSDTLTFRVDTNADATSFSPASGTVLSGSANSTNFTITLDRAANPSTVSNTTVALARDGGGSPSSTAKCPDTGPCTSITVDPSSALGEGRYVLSLDGVKSADEGLTFSGSASYSVPFIDDAAGKTVPGGLCVGTATDTDTGPISGTASHPGTVSFDWSFSGGGGWQAQLLNGTTQLSQTSGVAGSGHATFNATIPAGSTVLTLKFTVTCPGTLDTSNVIATRNP
jgi:hypothetical protein